jgi:hypothetical protein
MDRRDCQVGRSFLFCKEWLKIQLNFKTKLGSIGLHIMTMKPTANKASISKEVQKKVPVSTK